jgi:hypothetical protein
MRHARWWHGRHALRYEGVPLAHPVQRAWNVETNSHIDPSGGPSSAAGDSRKDSSPDIIDDKVLGRSPTLSPTRLKWGIVAVLAVIAAALVLAYLTPAKGGARNCGSPRAQPVPGENHCGQ